jgi:hypothetical protein
MANTTEPNTPTKTAAEAGPVVIDLGKKSRSKIKDLVRGTGSVVNEVQTTVDELKLKGMVSAEVQPIIVVVKERAKGMFD